jgi:hypothetical protein
MKKHYQRLYNKIYYLVSFRPKRTLNEVMKGNEHYMSNKELSHMRTKQLFEILTFKNVIIYKLYKVWQKRQKKNV